MLCLAHLGAMRGYANQDPFRYGYAMYAYHMRYVVIVIQCNTLLLSSYVLM
jgi:hypothetical protein